MYVFLREFRQAVYGPQTWASCCQNNCQLSYLSETSAVIHVTALSQEAEHTFILFVLRYTREKGNRKIGLITLSIVI
jgi:hypothetical protein